jgi:hypothetical protein
MLSLRLGVPVKEAQGTVVAQAKQVANLPSLGGAQRVLDAYLSWVGSAESALRHFFTQSSVSGLLHGSAYWYLREANAMAPSALPEVLQEIERKQLLLSEFARDLESRIEVYCRDGWQPHTQGTSPVVVDTSTLLLLEQPWIVDWPALTDRPMVRLIVPMRVVEELDRLDYKRGHDPHTVARAILSELEALVNPWPADSAKELNDRVTIEVLIEPGSRFRPEHGDEEILQTCQDLKEFTGKSPLLVAADAPMRFWARSLGLDVTHVPNDFIVKAPKAGT